MSSSPATGSHDVSSVSTASPRVTLDLESREWLRSLRDTGAARDDAVARLHALLLRAARFEVARRRSSLPHLRGDEVDDLANEGEMS